MRLIGTLPDEQGDEWQLTRRYMSRDTFDKLIDQNKPHARFEATRAP